MKIEGELRAEPAEAVNYLKQKNEDNHKTARWKQRKEQRRSPQMQIACFNLQIANKGQSATKKNSYVKLMWMLRKSFTGSWSAHKN